MASETMLTEAQRDKMAHCVGHPRAKGCATNGGRNNYCGSPDDADWTQAVEAGYAEVRKPLLVAPSVYYRVTPAGRAALAHDFALLDATEAGHGE